MDSWERWSKKWGKRINSIRTKFLPELSYLLIELLFVIWGIIRIINDDLVDGILLVIAGILSQLIKKKQK